MFVLLSVLYESLLRINIFLYLIQIKAPKIPTPVLSNLIFVFVFCRIFVFIVFMFLVSFYILKHILTKALEVVQQDRLVEHSAVGQEVRLFARRKWERSGVGG